MKVKFSDLIFIYLLLLPIRLFSQDLEATIKLRFEKRDTMSLCHAYVSSNDSAAADVSVQLFVQRMASQLQIGKAVTTDENGIASFRFPVDLPGDAKGNLTVIAKIEDDENYANTETIASIDWGLKSSLSGSQFEGRSLWGSRDKAPIYLIIAADLIICAVWGTLMYVAYLVFKIKRNRTYSINK